MKSRPDETDGPVGPNGLTVGEVWDASPDELQDGAWHAWCAEMYGTTYERWIKLLQSYAEENGYL